MNDGCERTRDLANDTAFVIFVQYLTLHYFRFRKKPKLSLETRTIIAHFIFHNKDLMLPNRNTSNK